MVFGWIHSVGNLYDFAGTPAISQAPALADAPLPAGTAANMAFATAASITNNANTVSHPCTSQTMHT